MLNGRCCSPDPSEPSRPICRICRPEDGIPPLCSPTAGAPRQCVQFPEAEEQQTAVLRAFYCALSTY